jgi:hypothetical protein
MLMKNVMKSTLVTLVFLLLSFTAFAQGEIYKVVDKDGNVTFTDQRPSADAQPMDLPPLSIIATDPLNPPPVVPEEGALEDEQPAPPTPSDLRKLYRDFRITRPTPEETFWGTENSVVITWQTSQPILPQLRVVVMVDGSEQQATGSGSLSLTLDRGEHQVYAELRDERNRRIVRTDTVTFFIQQHSVGQNRRGG